MQEFLFKTLLTTIHDRFTQFYKLLSPKLYWSLIYLNEYPWKQMRAYDVFGQGQHVTSQKSHQLSNFLLASFLKVLDLLQHPFKLKKISLTRNSSLFIFFEEKTRDLNKKFLNFLPSGKDNFEHFIIMLKSQSSFENKWPRCSSQKP